MFVECLCLIILGVLNVMKQNGEGIHAKEMGVNEGRVRENIESELMPTLLGWRLRVKVRRVTD